MHLKELRPMHRKADTPTARNIPEPPSRSSDISSPLRRSARRPGPATLGE